MATDIDLGRELVTYDGPITGYAIGHGRQFGLRVLS